MVNAAPIENGTMIGVRAKPITLAHPIVDGPQTGYIPRPLPGEDPYSPVDIRPIYVGHPLTGQPIGSAVGTGIATVVNKPSTTQPVAKQSPGGGTAGTGGTGGTPVTGSTGSSSGGTGNNVTDPGQALLNGPSGSDGAGAGGIGTSIDVPSPVVVTGGSSSSPNTTNVVMLGILASVCGAAIWFYLRKHHVGSHSQPNAE